MLPSSSIVFRPLPLPPNTSFSSSLVNYLRLRLVGFALPYGLMTDAKINHAFVTIAGLFSANYASLGMSSPSTNIHHYIAVLRKRVKSAELYIQTAQLLHLVTIGDYGAGAGFITSLLGDSPSRDLLNPFAASERGSFYFPKNMLRGRNAFSVENH